MSDVIRFGSDLLPFCCGVADVGGFELESPYWQGDEEGDISNLSRSGTGLFTATFVDDGACEAAYTALTKRHKLLYQSPLKTNDNSGNRLFLCVFEYRAPRRQRNARSGERLPNL